MIARGYKLNFDTLTRAFALGDVALLECQDRASGKSVNVICALDRCGDGDVTFVPFAKLFDGNPFEELNPPDPNGGFVS